jgi:hypothetical protein
MAKFGTNQRLGVNFVASALALMPVGSIVTGYDTVTDREGEFMYVQFAAITTEGQVVDIDHTNKCALSSSTNEANHGLPVGFSTGAFAADEYGFVQVSGKTKVKCNAAVAAGAKVMLTATAGSVDDAAINGSQLSGAEFDTADGTPAAGFAYATIHHPRIQTQVV